MWKPNHKQVLDMANVLKELTVSACALPYEPNKHKYALQLRHLRFPNREPVLLIMTENQFINPQAFFKAYAVKQGMFVETLYDVLTEKHVVLFADEEDFRNFWNTVYSVYLSWLIKAYKLIPPTLTPACIQYSLEFLLKRIWSTTFDLRLLKFNSDFGLLAIVRDNTLYIPLKAIKKLTNAEGKHYGLTFYALLQILVHQSSYLSIERLSDVEMLCIPKEKTPQTFWSLFEPQQEASENKAKGGEER